MSFIMTPSGREGMKKYGWRDMSKAMTVGTEIVDGKVCVSYIRPPVDNLIQQLADPAPGAETFVYQKLPPDSVRLLRRSKLSAEAGPGRVVFEFTICSLKDSSKPPPTYSAISYCWGDLPADGRLVFDDGSHLPITKKAARILARIAVDAEYIWLDAVCINQADLVEKALQIPLMADIYRRANSVEVWLGRDEGIPRVLSPAAQNPTTSPNAKFQIEYDPDRHDPFSPYSHQNVVDLIWSPWFERAWVVQEFCFARELRYHFGDVVLRPLFFDMVLKDLKSTRFVDYDKGQLQIPLPPMIRNFHTMRRLRHFQSPGSSPKGVVLRARLEDILCEFYGLKSTDPRDKVFAMLNFVVPGARDDIKVDYTRHPADVYHDAMESVLFRGTCFRLLGFAGLAAPRQIFDDRPNTPSWVPDLSTPPEHVVWSSDRKPGYFQATAPLPPKQAVSLKCFHAFDGRSIDPRLQNKGADGPDIADLELTNSYEHHHAFIVPHGKHIATVARVLPGDPSQNLAHLPQFISSAIQKTEAHCNVPAHKAKDLLRQTLIAENPDCLKRDPHGNGFDELCNLLFATKHHDKAHGKDSKEQGKAKPCETNSEPSGTTEPSSPLPTLFAKDTAHHDARSYVEAMLQEGIGSTRGLFWAVPVLTSGGQPEEGEQDSATRHHGIGLATNGVQPGDQVWLIVGAGVPFVLRLLGASGPDSEQDSGPIPPPGEGIAHSQQVSENCTGDQEDLKDEKKASNEKKDKSSPPPSFHLVCEAYVCSLMHAELDIMGESEPFLLF